jgi:tetratricopeptide (TPR) repeat protein
MKSTLWLSVVLLALLGLGAHACIWDADSLAHEKSRSKDLASAILGEPPAPDDAQKLRARIAELEAHRDETNADWWNNLAGAHLRLNEPEEAVKILEPVEAKFPNDYGIHANLGTAYHLLGRYTEAEKEIARDLEINPDAHFGLEKYHLALLQYLMRDAIYQSLHVYVDELTAPFLANDRNWNDFYSDDFFSQMAKLGDTNALAKAANDFNQSSTTNLDSESLAEISVWGEKPSYRKNWNLAENTNLEAGVVYMAQMNPKQPAVFEMLGVVAWRKRDYNLAVSAFEKAIALGSPKSDVLRGKIAGLNHHIANSGKSRSEELPARILGWVIATCLGSILLIVIWYVCLKIYRKICVG